MIRRALALAVTLLLGSCSLSPFDALDLSGAQDDTGRAVALVSRYRAAHGLRPVHADERLAAAAAQQARAVARAGALSHDVGTTFKSRMAAYAGNTAAAENLSMGPSSVEGALERWKKSPGHNANLLMPEARRIGMAHDGRYWALVLAQ